MNCMGSVSNDDGIGILVEMAKSGKIDPWNIDIIEKGINGVVTRMGN